MRTGTLSSAYPCDQRDICTKKRIGKRWKIVYMDLLPLPFLLKPLNMKPIDVIQCQVSGIYFAGK
jgi:hypothetical protein